MKITDQPTLKDLMAAAQSLGEYAQGRVAMRAALTFLNPALNLSFAGRQALLTLLNGAMDNFGGTAPQLMERNIMSDGQG